jgi:hypothetical protein
VAREKMSSPGAIAVNGNVCIGPFLPGSGIEIELESRISLLCMPREQAELIVS